MNAVQTTAEQGDTARGRRGPSWQPLAAAALALAVGAVVMAVVLDNDEGTLRLGHLPEGVTAQVVDGNDVFVSRVGNDVRVFLPESPHLPGDTLWWCPKREIFVALNSGSGFDRNGLPFGGPAPRALDQHPVEVGGDRLVIDTDSVIRGTSGVTGERPDELRDSSVRWPPDTGPGAVCEDPVAAPSSLAHQFEPDAGLSH